MKTAGVAGRRLRAETPTLEAAVVIATSAALVLAYGMKGGWDMNNGRACLTLAPDASQLVSVRKQIIESPPCKLTS